VSTPFCVSPNGSSRTLFQSGTLSGSSGRYIFNGAVSPDRRVNGATGQFGDSMVLVLNSASKRRYPDIRMVSKIGADPVSEKVLVKKSSVALKDFTCFPNPCR
jgi:hypothetical protein